MFLCLSHCWDPVKQMSSESAKWTEYYTKQRQKSCSLPFTSLQLALSWDVEDQDGGCPLLNVERWDRSGYEFPILFFATAEE